MKVVLLEEGAHPIARTIDFRVRAVATTPSEVNLDARVRIREIELCRNYELYNLLADLLISGEEVSRDGLVNILEVLQAEASTGRRR